MSNEDINNDRPWILLTAQVCHEANRAIQLQTGDPNPSPKWAEAPNWQKASAVEGVVKALNGATPEELHKSWMDFKLEDGWTHGPIKSEKLKKHPCLVPYNELPEEQKLKDHVFAAIVQTFKDTAFI